MQGMRALLFGAGLGLLGVIAGPWELAEGQQTAPSGGMYFHDRNDVDAEMQVAEALGSDYYTLTYQPPVAPADGKFRQIQVHLRDPNLHAMTKTGYYAPEPLTAADPTPQWVNAMDEISEAAQSNVAFDSLGVSIVQVVRHPDHNTADVTVLLKSTHLRWQATDGGAAEPTSRWRPSVFRRAEISSGPDWSDWSCSRTARMLRAWRNPTH
jgi:hypothetical protein